MMAVELPLIELLESPVGFVATMVSLTAVIGFWSRSLSIPAAGGYLMFASYALVNSIQFLTNIFYVSLVIMTLGIGFKIWRLEFGGDV